MGDEMLARVCELAFDVAKEGEAPAAMKNYLYLAQRPPRAYSVAQRALEEDTGFRTRVADHATIDNVGEAGYLWLHRPEGWEHRFALLNDAVDPIVTDPADRPPMPEPPVSARTPSPTVSSIESELASLRGLVDRLADERKNVSSSVSELEEELETRRAENLAMSTHLSALRTELEAVQTTEASVSTQRDNALRRIGELELKIDELSTELDRTRAELEEVSSARDTAQSDLAAVTAERNEIAAQLTEERSTSEARIAELTTARTQLTEDNTELASRVAVAEQARVDLEEQLEDISSKWQASTRQLAVYSGVNDQLDAAVSERNQLRQQLADARQRLAAVRSEIDSSHAQLSADLDDIERVVAAPIADVAAPDGGQAAPAAVKEADDEEPAPVEVPAESEIESVDPDGNDRGFDMTTELEPDGAERALFDDTDEPEAPDVDASDLGAMGADTTDIDAADADIADLNAAAAVTDHDAPDSDVDTSVEIEIDTDTHGGHDGADANSVTSVAETDEDSLLGAFGAGAGEAVTSDIAAQDADGEPDAGTEGDHRVQIDVPDDLTDEIDVARHVVGTPDVVLLIDGDGAAGLGWPHLDVAARRAALVNYLGQLTADTGAAADVVFERPVGGEDALPVSRAVRVRIADDPVGQSSLFSSIVGGYPREWPIAVVTDQATIADRSDDLQVTHLSNGQLLDLFLYLSSNG